MKKMFLSVAMLASACLFVNASGGFVPDVLMGTSMTVNQNGDFAEAKLESLNESVQKTIASYAETCTIKAIGYNAEKQLTKVIFVSKEDQSEKILILDDEGKEVK